MDKKSYILLSLLLFLVLISCAPKKRWHSATFVYFDTVCEIKIFCSPSEFLSCQQEVERIFSEIESHFSPGLKNYSSSLVLNLYHKSLSIYKNTNGCFDITIGPLSRIWGFLNKSYSIPSQNEIDQALRLIGMDKIEEATGTLILKPNMELDWGGIAKGFGIDLAYNALESIGIERGFINAGGDLFCWGKNPENETWKVGINHPRDPGYLGILSLSTIAAATTGDYQRFFEAGGRRYHHVFNPKSGYPAQGKQSVTVIGPEAVICDALSTALFVCQYPEEILDRYIEYGAVIVDSEGNVSLWGKPYLFRLL